MNQVILSIQGKYFQHQEFELMKYDRRLDKNKQQCFELNITLRKWQVDSIILQMETMYWKALQKVNFDYYFIIVFESKIGKKNK